MEWDTDLRYCQRYVGWCVELLQSAFIVADDIMDNGITRRGKACWWVELLHRHTLPGVGVGNGVNDILFLNTLIYRCTNGWFRILSNTIKDRELLLNVMEFFQRATMATIVGQSLDTNHTIQQLILHKGTSAYDLFTSISKNKTGHYSFLLPIQIGTPSLW